MPQTPSFYIQDGLSLYNSLAGQRLSLRSGAASATLPVGRSNRTMSQHHLDELSHALTQKGWRIAATRSLDDFPYDFHAWTIERGSVTLDIQFARFGGLGEDLPLEKSYACSVAGDDDISLYFSKPSDKWKAELASFVSALDTTDD